MTIGIAAWGPDAGLAVLDALRAAERVGTGSIGGYAVFAAITGDGRLLRHETQRGGTATLFVDGERTGAPPPDEVAGARIAAVMSSGPDRPAPLAQYLPADGAVGLVTGHRLPNAASLGGKPVNEAVLDQMRAGRTPEQAVANVLNGNPDCDAGVIAVGLRGEICARNSARVSRRPDLGSAVREHCGAGGGLLASIAVLHNAIHPSATLAPLLADIGMEVMTGLTLPDGFVTLRAGVPVEAADRNEIQVDDDMVVLRAATTDHRIVTGTWNCAAVYVGSTIKRGSVVLGQTIVEPNCVVADGCIKSLNGGREARVGFRAVVPGDAMR